VLDLKNQSKKAGTNLETKLHYLGYCFTTPTKGGW
jgi:hypothetical protein